MHVPCGWMGTLAMADPIDELLVQPGEPARLTETRPRCATEGGGLLLRVQLAGALLVPDRDGS